MTLYHVHFISEDGDIVDVVQFEVENDEAAVEQAHRIDVPSIGGRFELWKGNRLLYTHRHGVSAKALTRSGLLQAVAMCRAIAQLHSRRLPTAGDG